MTPEYLNVFNYVHHVSSITTTQRICNMLIIKKNHTKNYTPLC